MKLRPGSRAWVNYVVVLSAASAMVTSCGDSERRLFDDDDDAGGSGGGGLVSGGGEGGSAAGGGAGLFGPGGAGAGGSTPACDAPLAAPSAGSCITLTEDVECNPVTNEPCSQFCGNYGLGLFQCYTTTDSLQPVCGDCGNEDLGCIGGTTCPADEDWPGGSQCAKYCCDDADCGSGTCYKDGIATPDAPVGICLVAPFP